ncbi:MAG: site-specific integrase [Gammaproteobacteria bacterium]|nr:site-specific integrase [Gammaproteobacteria bacterium]
MPVVELSNQFMKHSLKCPDGKRSVEYCDDSKHGGVPGLYCRVQQTSQGQGTYYLRFKTPEQGKTAHIKIGRTTDITLAAARKEALYFRSEIAKGDDPQKAKQEMRSIPSFRTYMLEMYLPHQKKNRSYKEYVGLLNRRLFAEYGDRRLDQVTRQEAQAFHLRLRHEEGLQPASCDRYLALLKHAYRLAQHHFEVIKANPLERLELFKEPNVVTNLLSKEQLHDLVTILQRESSGNTGKVALWLLATGARVGETLHAKHSDIDRENMIWTVPVENAKTKKVYTKQLNSFALEILDSLDASDGYLFVNRKTGGRLTTISKVWSRLRNEAGVPHLRLHDLRHNFASIAAANGQSLLEIQKLLNHSNHSTTLRYSHLSNAQLRSSCQSVADGISAALGQS